MQVFGSASFITPSLRYPCLFLDRTLANAVPWSRASQFLALAKFLFPGRTLTGPCSLVASSHVGRWLAGAVVIDGLCEILATYLSFIPPNFSWWKLCNDQPIIVKKSNQILGRNL